MTTLRNAFANLAGYVISLTIGILFTPYIISKLGIVSYGVYPLIMSLFVWAGWISLSVNWSVGRFFTIAYSKGDVKEAAIIFNTSMVASLFMALGLLTIGLIVAPFAGSLFRLPPGTESAARALIIFGAIATAFGVLSGVVEVSFYCLNRFDYRAILQVARGLISVATVLLFFHLSRPRLEWVGLGSCVAAFVTAIIAFFWGRRLVPCLAFKPRLFSFDSLRAMMSTNFWVVVDQLGTILMLSMNLFLANRLFGPGVSAEYALAAQWENMLRSIMAALTVFTPQYVMLVARSDTAALRNLSLHASRFVSLAIGVCGGVLIGLSPWLPQIWLHRSTTLVGPLMSGLVIAVVLNAAANPLYGIWQALNRVKTPSLATLASGVISIALSLLLARFFHLGPWAIVVGAGIAYTLRNALFSFRYVGELVSVSQRGLARSAVTGVAACAVIAATVFLLASWVAPRNWLGAALVVTISLTLSGPPLLLSLINRAERTKIFAVCTMIKGRLKGPSSATPEGQ